MKELIGKTIVGLRINEDESVLSFDCSDGTCINYETYGDCCSETWFADILGVKALLNATVTDVEEVALEEVVDGRCRQEFDEFYGIKLTTTKGYVDIVYRNSSNGYYGGSIELVGLNYDNKAQISIVDDWQA